MKKLFSFAAALALLLSFTACCDSDGISGNDNPQSGENIADYTVIFWSMNGTLDEDVCANLGSLYNMRKNGLVGKNVNFVGLVKPSSNTHHITHLQDSLKQYNLDGTLYIDLPANPTATLPNMEYNIIYEPCPVSGTEMMARIYKAYNAKRYGDSLYSLNNPDTIAAFIKKVAQTHPAKHYELLLLGHGSGYGIFDEAPNAEGYTTRSCVCDSYNDDEGISADNLVAGVNKSGVHIQSLFFHCCLMATLENLAAYQHCADYAILSAETTTLGYFPQYVKNLSNAGDDIEKMKAASKATVDYYVDNVTRLNPLGTSQGFWDLSQVNTMLGTVAKISNWYSDAIDKDPDYISLIVAKTVQAADYEEIVGMVSGSENRDSLLRAQRNWIFNYIKQKKAGTAATIDTLTRYLVNISSVPMPYGFCLAHMANITLSAQAQSNGTLDFDTLTSLYTEYMNELKSASYIRVNNENKSISPDYAYLFCSPTVNMFAMNKEHFKRPGVYRYDQPTLLAMLREFNQALHDGDNEKIDSLYMDIFDGCYFGSGNLDKATSYYQASQFDQQCHWSNFLKKLTFNPSYVTNPSRSDYDKWQ